MTALRRLMRALPRPVARVVGRAALRVHPGLREVHGHVAAYASAWDRWNASVLAGLAEATGPLWVVLGDSTAQGIGAHGPEHGYVGQVRTALEKRDGKAWSVLNLSKSGAKAEHVIDVQLPRFEELDVVPDLVTCAIGANDLVRRTPPAVLEAQLAEIVGRLPKGSVVATLPHGLRPDVAAAVNASIVESARRAGLRVADVWRHTNGPWQGRLAADGFHPNAHGYEAWAAAFEEALAG